MSGRGVPGVLHVIRTVAALWWIPPFAAMFYFLVSCCASLQAPISSAVVGLCESCPAMPWLLPGKQYGLSSLRTLWLGTGNQMQFLHPLSNQLVCTHICTRYVLYLHTWLTPPSAAARAAGAVIFWLESDSDISPFQQESKISAVRL